MRLTTLLMTVLLWASVQPQAQAASQPTARHPAPVGASWPQRHEGHGHSVLLYQPQVDAWENHARIAFRAAIAVRPSGQKDYVYGVLQVQADTRTDVDTRTVLVTNTKRELRFPTVSHEAAARLVGIVDAVMPRRESITVSLDLVLAYAQSSSAQQHEVEVNLEPPPIFYSQKPAILVMFMGAPQLKPVGNTPLMFVINTNWDVFYDTSTSTYFLLHQDAWLTTIDLLKGPWIPARSVPPSFSALPDDPTWAEVKKYIPGKPTTRAPVVFTSTQPAEMILVDGEPTYSPVPGTKLMALSNSASVVFLHTAEKQYYFLVAGRWFRAPKLLGPWSPATQDLPQDFRRIPANHPLTPVRASVPGTEEARDAILLASVPTQTEVKVGQAAPTTVAYQGTPKLQAIPNTTVRYAVNTPHDVFVVENRYYWVYQGVWYCSAAAAGPWTVCSAVPTQIYQIPASHPKHNVTYVYVYDATPDTVVVGYTAGYQGEYVAAGVLMFGAGVVLGAALADNHPYYYYGHYGWPPPPAYYAYGSAVYYSGHYGGYYGTAHAYGPYGSAGAWAGYNPATGTYARGGYASGPYASAGWGAAYNPYTGSSAVAGQVSTPYGSRGGYAAYNPYTGSASRGGYASGSRGSVYAQAGFNPSTGTAGARVGYTTPYGSGSRGYVQQGDAWARGGSRSTSQGTMAGVQTSRGGAAAGVQTSQGSAAVARTASGDVYVGNDGNVYKKSEGSWQKHTSGGWETVQPPSQSTPQAISARTSSPTTTQAASGTPLQGRQPASLEQSSGGARWSGTQSQQSWGQGRTASAEVSQGLQRDFEARQRGQQQSERFAHWQQGGFAERGGGFGGGGFQGRGGGLGGGRRR